MRIVRTLVGEPATVGGAPRISRGLVTGSADIRGPGSASVDSGRPRRARSTTPMPKFFPELPPSYQVAIAARAMHKIRRAVDANRYLEVSGWLYGHDDSDSIVFASVGEAANPTSAWLDPDEWGAVRRMAPNLRPVGDAHSHPSGDLLPSETDMRAWSRGAKLAGGHWVGLILGPSRDMWSQPSCAAWITVANGNLPFCEPLRLREI
jgi:proteasome lid subunit RPN8/RPN11